jgi:hypothetical protein
VNNYKFYLNTTNNNRIHIIDSTTQHEVVFALLKYWDKFCLVNKEYLNTDSFDFAKILRTRTQDNYLEFDKNLNNAAKFFSKDCVTNYYRNNIIKNIELNLRPSIIYNESFINGFTQLNLRDINRDPTTCEFFYIDSRSRLCMDTTLPGDYTINKHLYNYFLKETGPNTNLYTITNSLGRMFELIKDSFTNYYYLTVTTNASAQVQFALLKNYNTFNLVSASYNSLSSKLEGYITKYGKKLMYYEIGSANTIQISNMLNFNLECIKKSNTRYEPISTSLSTTTFPKIEIVLPSKYIHNSLTEYIKLTGPYISGGSKNVDWVYHLDNGDIIVCLIDTNIIKMSRIGDNKSVYIDCGTNIPYHITFTDFTNYDNFIRSNEIKISSTNSISINPVYYENRYKVLIKTEYIKIKDNGNPSSPDFNVYYVHYFDDGDIVAVSYGIDNTIMYTCRIGDNKTYKISSTVQIPKVNIFNNLSEYKDIFNITTISGINVTVAIESNFRIKFYNPKRYISSLSVTKSITLSFTATNYGISYNCWLTSPISSIYYLEDGHSFFYFHEYYSKCAGWYNQDFHIFVFDDGTVFNASIFNASINMADTTFGTNILNSDAENFVNITKMKDKIRQSINDKKATPNYMIEEDKWTPTYNNNNLYIKNNTTTEHPIYNIYYLVNGDIIVTAIVSTQFFMCRFGDNKSYYFDNVNILDKSKLTIYNLSTYSRFINSVYYDNSKLAPIQTTILSVVDKININ